MNQQDATKILVAILEPFQQAQPAEDEPASDRDAVVRAIVRDALRELGVYDAHGCPLCLS